MLKHQNRFTSTSNHRRRKKRAIETHNCCIKLQIINVYCDRWAFLFEIKFIVSGTHIFCSLTLLLSLCIAPVLNIFPVVSSKSKSKNNNRRKNMENSCCWMFYIDEEQWSKKIAPDRRWINTIWCPLLATFSQLCKSIGCKNDEWTREMREQHIYKYNIDNKTILCRMSFVQWGPCRATNKCARGIDELGNLTMRLCFIRLILLAHNGNMKSIADILRTNRLLSMFNHTHLFIVPDSFHLLRVNAHHIN